MRECRAEFNGDVAVATFEMSQELKYLDLAELRPANPFLLGDEGAVPEERRDPDVVAAVNPLVQSLVATQFLGELGRCRPGQGRIRLSTCPLSTCASS